MKIKRHKKHVNFLTTALFVACAVVFVAAGAGAITRGVSEMATTGVRAIESAITRGTSEVAATGTRSIEAAITRGASDVAATGARSVEATGIRDASEVAATSARYVEATDMRGASETTVTGVRSVDVNSSRGASSSNTTSSPASSVTSPPTSVTSSSILSSLLSSSSSPFIATATPAPSPADLLIHVNKSNKLPDGYAPDLVAVDNVLVSAALTADFDAMRKAAEADGTRIRIRDGYRSYDEQEQVYDSITTGYVEQGNTRAVAVERAGMVVALPGYSEHHTGLAIDFSYGADADAQAVMWEWLGVHAHEYGFILRYPESREDITGYSYEPWHYRYVGIEHARAIYEQGLTLEEYLEALEHERQ